MKQFRKLLKISVSLLLSLLMLVYAFPMEALAFNIGNETETELPSGNDSDVPESSPHPGEIYEVIDLREETVKHIHLADGSYVAVAYETPIHYLDEEGKWQDIDNRLSELGGEFTTSDQKIKFAKKITGNETLFTIHNGNHKLTFSLIGADKKTEGIVQAVPETEEPEDLLQKMIQLKNLSSSIRYEDILDQTDLEYILHSNTVKENIIVKAPTEEYRYSFELNLNNLDAVLNEDGSVSVKDEESGEVVYYFPAPVVYDAAGDYSYEAVSYSLEENKNKGYILTVTADSDWMNAADRVFPVTVDPTIAPAKNKMTTTYIDSSAPDEVYFGSSTLKAGYDRLGKEFISYWKTTGLPTLPNSANITSAKLGLNCVKIENYGSSIDSVTLGVYEVTSVWATGFTWATWKYNGYGKIDNTLKDYAVVKADNVGKYVEWDITETVEKWYQTPSSNYGVAIRTLNDYNVNALFHSLANIGKTPPYLMISYNEIRGLEDYWSYSSHSAGNAGTGHVNLATGELTFSLPTLTSGEKLVDYDLKMIYNQPKNQVNDYLGSNSQTNFQLSCQETITPFQYYDKTGEKKTGYLWCDGDGTEHSFVSEDENKYYDEDGLGQTLFIVNNTDGYYEMESKTKLTRHFSLSGHLIKITDKIGNQLVITYNGDISSASATGQTISAVQLKPSGSNVNIMNLVVTYNAEKLLTSIQNGKTSEKTTYQYDGAANLYKVIYEKNNLSRTYSYEYYNNGRLKSAYDETACYGITYAYDASGRVSRITEIGGAKKVSGQTIGFSYGDRYSEVRTSGGDDLYETSDDIITHYSFDRFSRCISSYSTNVKRDTIYGATSGTYADSAENVNLTNKLTQSAVSSASAPNLFFNGGFETGDISYYSGSAAIVTEKPKSGKYCASITPGNILLKQDLMLNAGYYTLSFAYKTDDPSNLNFTLTITGGNFEETIVCEESDEYKTYSCTFEVTNENYPVGFWFQVSKINSSGSVPKIYLDDIMLTPGKDSSPFNAVVQGNLNVSPSTKYGNIINETLWDTVECDGSITKGTYVELNDPVFGRVLALGWWNETVEDLCAFRQTLYRDDDEKRALKNISIQLSGFGKATELFPCDASKFRLYLEVKYQNKEIQIFDLDFQRITGEWQYVSGIFNTKTDCVIQEIVLYCEYSGNFGDAYFADLCVAWEYNANQSFYIYDEEGRLKTVENSVLPDITYEYADSRYPDLVTKIESWKGTISYVYDEFGLVTSVTQSAYGTTTEYTYNSYGLCTSVKTTDKTGHFTRSFTTYNTSLSSSAFGAPLTQTNTNGEVTRYFYNMDGSLKATVSPDTTALIYTYDAWGRMTNVESALWTGGNTFTESDTPASVAYQYDSNARLSDIITGTTKYSLYYDVFGNSNSVYAGNHTLANYGYNDKNGKLATLTYGNGTKVRYEYDSLDRISKILYTETGKAEQLAYEYHYDKLGNLIRYEDCLRKRSYLYTYDSSSRLIGCREVEDSGTSVIDENKYSYDQENSRLIAWNKIGTYQLQSEGIGKFTYDISYMYSPIYLSNINGSVRINEGDYWKSQLIIIRDDFGRLEERSYAFIKNEAYSMVFPKQIYEYGQGASGSESDQIEKYTSSVGQDNTFKQSLTYDSNGNITSVRYNGYLVNRYYYDDLGQLVREDSREKSYTYYYTYDGAGNLLYKEAFPLTINDGDSLSGKTPVYTNVYQYGDSTWGDLLTSYKGHTITYDEIGNPLSYYGRTSYTFTWEKGRQLVTAKTGGYTLSFEYNDQGIRTSKTVNGVKHTYSLEGSLIVSEEYGDYLLIYLYDETNSPYGIIRHNKADGTTSQYYLERDVFGNIIAIYNRSGTKVVSYCYDAWGNCTVVTNTDSIATMNPFRYRGYYLDVETNLYYLQTRYYDSYVGRFINADRTINGNGDIVGFNMFAYCSNNPVMFTDPMGKGIWQKICNWFTDTGNWLNENIIQPVGNVINNVVEDISNVGLNIFNDNESIVLEANYFSFYKGQLVICEDWGFTNGRSGSFGILFLNNNQRNSETLNHEHGHFIQLSLMGPVEYTFSIAIPSVTSSETDPCIYYSQPWERSADIFGGVDRPEGYVPGSDINSMQYTIRAIKRGYIGILFP